jgi:hypothetical protein
MQNVVFDYWEKSEKFDTVEFKDSISFLKNIYNLSTNKNKNKIGILNRNKPSLFYLNDAEYISELAQVDRPRALPQLKFLDYFDEVAIAGASDPTWYRPSDDYSKKVEWLMCDFEHDVGWSKYVKETNRPAIMEWFKWTPEMVVGFTKSKWFHNLTNDHYYGKLGINSTKLIGYREAYPGMIDRIKKTGFETVDPLIAEFEQHLTTKYKGLPYRGTVTRNINQILQLESQ